MTPLPEFSVIALALVVAGLAVGGVGASVAVWRIGSLTVTYRGRLIGAIALMAVAGIGWIVFVSPVYVD